MKNLLLLSSLFLIITSCHFDYDKLKKENEELKKENIEFWLTVFF